MSSSAVSVADEGLCSDDTEEGEVLGIAGSYGRGVED